MKKISRKRATVSEQAPTVPVRDMVELLLTIPELKEAYGPAELALAIEDIGYISPSSYKDSREQNPRLRNRTIAMSRAFWYGDPLADQAVRLWTDFAVGTGVTYKAKDSKIQTRLDQFWKYRKNKSFTSSLGQQQQSRNLLVDGDIFFAAFGAEGERKVLRTIDPLQIPEIISDPEDEEEVLCFKRIDAASPPRTRYYKNWTADDAQLEGLKDPESNKAITVEEDVLVYQASFQKFGKRGKGLLVSSLGWTKEHQRFMAARVAITQALSKFANKLTVKGGQKTVDAIAAKVNSSISGSGVRGLPERNPPNAPGGTWAQNLGIDLSPMPRMTGAGDAKTDGDQLKLMACAGTNTPIHYFGDNATGNLATSDAIEIAVFKSYTSYQELWKDVWRDLYSIVLEENIDEDPAVIRITLPQILQDDLRKLGAFLTGFHQVFPEAFGPEILQSCLVALGINNVEEVMASSAARKTELATQAMAVLPHQLPTIVKAPGQPTNGRPAKGQPTVEAYIAAMNNLAESIRAL